MIKYVIFDMDGTLIDTEPFYEQSWNETGKRWGVEVRDMYAEYVCGRSIENVKNTLKERFGEGFDSEGFMSERMTLYAQLAEKGLMLKVGCREILDFLREHGIPCAVATSTVSDLTYSNLDRVNIRQFFDAVVTGDMVKNGKPSPDIFLEAGRRIGAEAGECIVCEDSYSGIEAASNAKMKPVFIPDRRIPTEETDRLAYATVSSLFEVIELIKKENKIN